MTFDIRGEQFNITFVNNYVREKYQDMVDLADELSDLPNEADAISEEGGDKKTQIAKLKELKRKQRALVKQIGEVRDEILREILETNGYEYDAQWWRRKTDANDINNFVLGCVQKDVNAEAAQSKKK